MFRGNIISRQKAISFFDSRFILLFIKCFQFPPISLSVASQVGGEMNLQVCCPRRHYHKAQSK